MTLHANGRRLIATVSLLAAIAALAAMPTAAYAKTTFSSKTPASGSSITNTTPKLSVYIYDSYGIKGSKNFVMKLAGRTVHPKITYKTSHGHRDYKRITLWLQLGNPRALGEYSMYVRTHNVRHKTASTTWKFTIVESSTPPPPPPPTPPEFEEMPVTIDLADCPACHASTPSGAAHKPLTPGVHATSSALCVRTGCHVVSLTTEHYRWEKDGAHLSCATCHASTSSRIVAAIRAGSTACESCHDLTAAHVASTKSHVLAVQPDCSRSGMCHVGLSDIAAIHAPDTGCTVCHRPGRTPSQSCTVCHAGTPLQIHSRVQNAHTATDATCVSALCHSSDAAGIHEGTGKPGCVVCHGVGVDPTIACSACHSRTLAVVHPNLTTAHTADPAPGCTADEAGCHTGGADAPAIHSAVPRRTDNGCGICHASGKTATAGCGTSGCHPASTTGLHGSHPSKVTAGIITINNVSYGSRTCLSCHATMELQAAHGGSAGCGVCHPTARASVPKWTGTCNEGACHTASSTRPMHGAADTVHKVPAAAACTALCHTGGGTDIIKIHSAVAGRTDSGCGICHTKGATAAAVCDTPGCHPANGLHSGHPSKVSSGTITLAGVVSAKLDCTKCHLTTELQSVHGGGSKCGVCHPNPRESVPTWNGSCVQGDCHKFNTFLAMHGSANASHTVAAAAGCTAITGCHAGATDVATIHSKVTGRTDTGCTICHTPGATAAPVCDSAGCHPSAKMAPHESHPSKVTSGAITLATMVSAKLYCTVCHVTTELQAAHGGDSKCAVCHPKARATVPKWTGSCNEGGCHTASSTLPMHAGANASHTVAVAAGCAPGGACHTGGTDVAKIHSGVADRTDTGCTICHGKGVTTPAGNCELAGCHLANTTALHSSHPSKVTSGTITLATMVSAKLNCTFCHVSTELQAAHGGAAKCAVCHPTARATVPKWAGSCNEGGCHTASSTLPMHAGANASHTIASAASCTTGGPCHTGGTDVAKIHSTVAGRTDTGCGICHTKGATTPAGNCNLTGCHAAKTTALHASHPSSPAPATFLIKGASYGVHACAECHTTDLWPMHGGATGCSKCHLSPRDSVPTWNGGCVQGNCHKPTSTLEMHRSIDASHSTNAVKSCSTGSCHPGGTDAAAIHSGITGHGASGCGACHVSGKTPSLDCAACHSFDLATTHDPYIGASHDMTSTVCVNRCHVPDVVAVHGAAGGPGCAACHAADKTPSLLCKSCHPEHGLALHPATTDAHVAQSGPCVGAGCHVSNVMTLHGEGGGAPGSCAQCHNPHANAPRCAACHAPGVVPSLDCQSSKCHLKSNLSAHDAHVSKVTSGTIVLATMTSAKLNCTLCHVSTELQTVHGGDTTCGVCHPTARASVPVWNGSCAQGNCHAGTSKSPMHASANASHTVAAAASCTTLTGCHAGGTDIAKIHSTVAKRDDTGCGICHTPGHTAAAVCDASGCHAANAMALHDSHPARAISATITINLVRYGSRPCSDCHGPMELQSIHGGDTSCAVCHPTARATVQSWGGSCVTGGCHTASSTRPMHKAIDSAHNAPTQPSCTTLGTCHTGGIDVAAIHASVKRRTDSGCGICHVAGGPLPTLTCEQPGCHTNGDLTAVHAPYVGDKHNLGTSSCVIGACHAGGTDAAAAHAAKTGCVACHVAGKTPSVACVDCHTGAVISSKHPSGTTAHTATREHACQGTLCHGADSATLHAGSLKSCTACHSAAGATPRGCYTTGTYGNGCHDLAWASFHAGYAGYGDYHGSKNGDGRNDIDGYYSTGGLLPPYTYNVDMPCGTCHVQSGTSNKFNFPTVINGKTVVVPKIEAGYGASYPSLCSACHGGGVKEWHAGCGANALLPVGSECHDNGDGTYGPDLLGSDCSQCHQHDTASWPHGRFWGGMGIGRTL
jgi:hypothetical protein